MCIVDYNQFMGGVDKGDQYRKYYHVRVKSRKYSKYFSPAWSVAGGVAS